jgi:serine/threonine protein kinase
MSDGPDFVRVRPIARGAFGERWLVTRARDHKLCTMQILPCATPEDAQSALAEAELLCRVSAAHAVRYFTAFVSGCSLCIVARGGALSSLDDILFDCGELDASDCLTIAAQTAAALTQLHKKGVTHRSLVPDSILLDSRGRVRLAEAGFFALLCEGGHAGALADTFTAYLAPELVR